MVSETFVDGRSRTMVSTEVEIFIDGKYMYDAPYGGLRVDVEAAFPNVDGSLLSGYSLAFGYADLGSGQHTVRAVAYDSLGNSTEQSSTFNVVVYDKNFINSNEVVDLSRFYIKRIRR